MKTLNLSYWKSYLCFPDRLVLSLAILIVTCIAGAIIAISDKQETHTSKLISQLNTLEKNINTLQLAVNQPLPKIDLHATNEQIQKVSQQLEEVRARNASHVDESMKKTEATLNKELLAIQDLVRHLDNKKESVTFLSPQSLPFQILSLDSIQSIPVASVAYDFKTVPLEKNDSLAGWRIVAIDYGKQHIEFANTKNEHVLLTHEHIG